MRRPARGGVVYSPSFQSGSCRIASTTMCRHIALRPAIATGRHASGIHASANPGWDSAHTQVCMPPIEVPITSLRCETPSCSSMRYCASTMSV